MARWFETFSCRSEKDDPHQTKLMPESHTQEKLYRRGSRCWRLERGARALREIARESGDPFAAREQLFGMHHPEVTCAPQQGRQILERAGVVIDNIILSKLGVVK